MTDDELALVARSTPATDLLEERGLDEDAARLRDAPAKADLLERAVSVLEAMVDFGRIDGQAIVKMISEHRGETPESTLARLNPTDPAVRMTIADALRSSLRRIRDVNDRHPMREFLIGGPSVPSDAIDPETRISGRDRTESAP